jgi:hypothetical protein
MKNFYGANRWALFCAGSRKISEKSGAQLKDRSLAVAALKTGVALKDDYIVMRKP